MTKWLKKNIAGVFFLLLGVLFMLNGIHRDEHLTVEKKSSVICMECIGIG